MTAMHQPSTAIRYARTIEVSKRVRWDIDRDVIRGRTFGSDEKFLPDGLSRVDRLQSLSPRERRLLGRIQGRTYGNMFALVERYIGAKMLELAREHALGDQNALEALVRVTDEELKHQELFRRIEALVADGMPAGYRFVPQPDEVAQFVLGKSSWAVLALTCHIEIFSQVHYRESIAPDPELSPLFKDVFFFHWKEESQHAIIDELEWQRIDARTSEAERDAAVDDLIALVAGIDGLLQMQAAADGDYFAKVCGRELSADEKAAVGALLLAAYRWQYIVSGAVEPRFVEDLGSLITPAQNERIGAALAPLMQ
ncbi:MAG TPA: diiron oxygenase [Casimicrobiaceae bacterium]|nr:diiron oxygenase [Casimicrobiaceae bacterium]